jgi:5-methyltetrahydropteroyltriglutamate--homocysteine methyltransferase
MLQVTDTLIPATMVGSYPRPRWYTRRLYGGDIREALMEQNWREEYEDAVKAVLNDQEVAGLSIVSDGEMYEDDLVGGAGWPEYTLARLGRFSSRSAQVATRPGVDQAPIVQHLFESWPRPVITERVTRGPLRFAYLYELAGRFASRPIKMSFADPQLIARGFVQDEYYGGRPGQPSQDLVMDLVGIYNQELRELAAAGCPIYQSDLPPFAQLGMLGAPASVWDLAINAFNTMVEGTGDMRIWMHSCWGRPYGQLASGKVGDFRPMFPRVFEANFHVLNLECGDCLGPEMELLEQVPADRGVAIGVLDHRVLQVESAQQIADRIRRALKHIAAERLYVSSFCGLGTTLPRTVAFYKLKALVDGTNLVRAELTGQHLESSGTRPTAALAG